MSVQRSPPNSELKLNPPLVHYNSDSALNLPPSDLSISNRCTDSPNYVFQRAKRLRDQDYDSDFTEFKTEVKTLISNLISKQSEEIKKISSTLMEIRNTNNSIELSMASLTSQNEELKKKIELLETKSKKDDDYIVLLEDKIEDLQRGSRKSSIEIKNVPKIGKETKDSLVKMVVNLSNQIDSSIKEIDIRDIFRVPSKRDSTKNGQIILEMVSTMKKTDFLKAARSFNKKTKDKLSAKHLGLTTSEDTPIYVSEQLTTKGARLFFLARDLAKSKEYKYCWTNYGRIYVKKDDDSRIISINSEQQVNKLMQQQ